jgi:hypothetical protein
MMGKRRTTTASIGGQEETRFTRSTCGTIGCGGPASVAGTLPIALAFAVDAVTRRKRVHGFLGETQAGAVDTVVTGRTIGRARLALRSKEPRGA